MDYTRVHLRPGHIPGVAAQHQSAHIGHLVHHRVALALLHLQLPIRDIGSRTQRQPYFPLVTLQQTVFHLPYLGQAEL